MPLFAGDLSIVIVKLYGTISLWDYTRTIIITKASRTLKTKKILFYNFRVILFLFMD